MKLNTAHRRLATATILIFFLSLPSPPARAVNGNVTTVDATVSGDVYGNTGGTNTPAGGPNVPSAGDPRNVTNNTAIIESTGRVTGDALGGITYGDGDVAGNAVIIKGAVDGNTVGGYATGDGDVISNTATVSGDVGEYAIGGYAKGSGDVSNNTVAVTVSGDVGEYAIGGYAIGNGNVAGNSVDISGVVQEYAIGGHTKGDGDVSNNTVTVSGDVGEYVIGGYAEGNGGVTGNTVTISGGVTDNVIGGYTEGNGDITHNVVTVSGSVDGCVIGGIGSGSGGSGTVTGNQVVVKNGGVVGNGIQGGLSEGLGAVTGNTVAVSGVVTGDVQGGEISNLASTATVSGNAVILEADGIVNGSISGGLNRGNGAVTGNTVVVSGVVTGDVNGGVSRNDGNVTGNTVVVSGTVSGFAMGGYSLGAGNIADNTVTVSGAVADVFGGYSNGGDVTGNIVTISRGASITGVIYGGKSTGTVSGNTLNVNRFRGSVREINLFQNYNFALPLGLYAGDTLITITGGTPTDLTGSHIAVSNNFSPGAFSKPGDTIALISQAGGPFTTNFSGIAYGGLSEKYNLDIHANSGALVLEASGVGVNPQTKALSQGLISEIITLNRASDLLTGAGIDQAKAALKKQGGGPALFASVSYADTRTKTGSHIDSDGWAGLAGIAWKEDASDDTGFLASFFLEGGHGSFSAYNNFSGLNSVTSSGDTDYAGLGLMGHYRFANRVRLEASARFGHVESDYTASGYAGGLRPSFDLGGKYYGAHVGAGYDLDLTDKLNLDLVARYLWTLREGETVTVLGEKIRFDDIHSHRIRAGGRLSYEPTPAVLPFVGLYGEYEFDGESEARNKTADIRHHPLKIRGATCIGELGFSVTPESVPDINVDFSVQGHAGRREGFVGNFAFVWNF